MISRDDLCVHAEARYHSLLREAEAERLVSKDRPVARRHMLLDPIRLLVALIMGMFK